MRLEKDQKHATELADKAAELIEEKYLVGAKNHGGDIKRKLLLPHANEEAVDMMVYLLTMEEQWREMIDLINHASTEYKAKEELIDRLYNILTTGNQEGIEEELNRCIDSIITTQDTNHDKNRNQHCFPEYIKQQRIQRGKHTNHQTFHNTERCHALC